MIQQKITEIAEILGWSVDFSEPQNGKTDVNFAKYTSYGQDFNFSVELEGVARFDLSGNARAFIAWNE